jgi:hypothetical protein
MEKGRIYGEECGGHVGNNAKWMDATHATLNGKSTTTDQ